MCEMSLLSSDICVNDISKEDFYNKLYWDHRIYDLRCEDDYNQGHICRAHHMHPLPIGSIDAIFNIDQDIDQNYGRSEHPSNVLIYTNHPKSLLELNIFIDYLRSNRNPSSKLLKEIHVLTNGYEDFRFTYPYLCSDSIYYNESIGLVWPSYITPNLYLGSSMCRNETIISLLKITHVMSFSDYPQRKIERNDIQTFDSQISDSLSSNLFDFFPRLVQWISTSINDQKGIVLVHCDQGVSRSPTVVIAYLLSSNLDFTSVNGAFNYVKSKRNVIRPNTSFLRQLEEHFISIRMQNK